MTKPMARLDASAAPAASSSNASLWQRGGSAAPADESRLLMLAESVGQMGHWHWDLQTDRLTWSDQLFEICGVDAQTFPLTFPAAIDICHPDDRARVERLLRDAATGCDAFEFDCRLLREGDARTVICKGQPEFDSSGQVTALYGVLADVTDAFAAIRAIHDQKEMLDRAAQLAHLGHWTWSADGEGLALCSDELARIHDLTPAAFTARFTHPAHLAGAAVEADRARYLRAVETALAAPSSFEIEYQIRTATGAIKDIREIGQPIVDDDGRLHRFIATVQDITEGKRRETELARAKEDLNRRTRELEDSNLQKDKLFSIIAHDLRSPFNTLMGFAEFLALKADDLPRDKIAHYAQIVRDSAGDVQALLDNLLTWASFQMQARRIHPLPVDLRDLAAKSLEPLQLTAQAKGITVDNSIPAVSVMGDADLICIVLRNLVSNGIKFSRHGGSVQLSAAPIADSHPGMVRVTVRDDGVGMRESALQDLFDLQCATSTAGTEGEKGTGIGLHLCRDIVAQHGGVIEAHSAPDAGTAVHFTLPQA